MVPNVAGEIFMSAKGYQMSCQVTREKMTKQQERIFLKQGYNSESELFVFFKKHGGLEEGMAQMYRNQTFLLAYYLSIRDFIISLSYAMLSFRKEDVEAWSEWVMVWWKEP